MSVTVCHNLHLVKDVRTTNQLTQLIQGKHAKLLRECKATRDVPDAHPPALEASLPFSSTWKSRSSPRSLACQKRRKLELKA